MMLKNTAILIFSLTIISFSFSITDNSQKSFSLFPDSRIVSLAKPDKINDFSANMINNTNDNLNLQWKLLENSLVKEWDYSICNYGKCLVGIPSSGKMRTIKKGEKGFLNLHVNPYNIKGSGKVSFYIYEEGQENFGDTLIYIVTAK